jgi:hypothetical protein
VVSASIAKSTAIFADRTPISAIRVEAETFQSNRAMVDNWSSIDLRQFFHRGHQFLDGIDALLERGFFFGRESELDNLFHTSRT